MATTPNYGFIMPDPTDLVTDLPADFEIFGDEVDLRVKALNPETTEGDLAYRGATADAKVRLGIGTVGQVLAVNTGATAPEWISLGAAGGMTLISTTALTGGISTVTLSAIPQTFKSLILWAEDLTTAAAGNLNVRVNGITTNTYMNSFFSGNNTTVGSDFNTEMSQVVQTRGLTTTVIMNFFNYTSGTPKIITNNSFGLAATLGSSAFYNKIYYIDQTAINSITLIQHANWTAGTVFLYGVS